MTQTSQQACYLTTHAVCSIQTAKSQSIPLPQKKLVIFFIIIIIIFSFFTYLGSIFIPIIWTSPKNSSLTSWESLSMYLTKVANSALSEKSIVSSAILLKSVAVIKRDKSPTSRWSLLQVRHPSAEFLEMFVAHLLLNVSAPEYPRHLSPYNRQHLQSSL